MSTLLRLAALLAAIRVATVLHLRDAIAPAAPAAALSMSFVVAHLAFALIFLLAARAPLSNLSAVYGAILLAAGTVVTDLYYALLVLPAHLVLVTVIDLVLSFSLLVGMLESLPRLLKSPPPPGSSPR